MLPDMRETTEGCGPKRFTATALQALWLTIRTLMHWTWETAPRSFGETVGIKFTNKSITSTSLGKIIPPIRRYRRRMAGDTPGQNLMGRGPCGMEVRRSAQIR